MNRLSELTSLAVFLISTSVFVPSAFAIPELKLSSGAASVDILDAAVKDSCNVADCVTYIGAVGSWQVDVTTGMEGGIPFFDLHSLNSIRSGGQKSPLTISFSDDGLTLPSALVFDVGGTLSSTSSKRVITFQAWTDTVKFGHAKEIGSVLTFHTTPFSATTKGSTGTKHSAVTIGAVIDLGSINAKGTMSFGAALTPVVPEPATISMLGGALLLMGSALRRGKTRN